MPYRETWGEPELYLEHEGVKVYHMYKNNQWESGPMTYWFTLDPYADSTPEVFNVRSLPAWKKVAKPLLDTLCTVKSDPDMKKAMARFREQEPDLIRQVIILSIEGGVLCP
jgi:hypothetical protein